MDSITDPLSKRLPDLVSGLIAQADEFMTGLHVLPGTGGKPEFVGDPPAWFAIRSDDYEYIWALNRMMHWPVLLRAYRFTGEKAYAEKVAAELDDWLIRAPRPEIVKVDIQRDFNSPTPWRTLEAGIRMFASWPELGKLRNDSVVMSSEREARFSASVYQHAELLAVVPAILWPNADHNHYLQEMLGLLFASDMLADLAEARQWREQAMAGLCRCAEAQLTPDGGQIEGCPHYHNLCIYWLARALIIAKQMGLEFPASYRESLRNALDYSIYSFRPSGTCVPWGDSDPDQTAVVAAAFGYFALEDGRWMGVLSRLLEPKLILEALKNRIWELPDPIAFLDALEKGEFAAQGKDFPLVNWQRELSQVAMRTDWTTNAVSVFFACRTPINNAHAHADPMGFDLTALGKPIFVDPGRFTYRNDQDRRNFKSAAWHNTVTVDRREPFEYRGSWEYSPQKDGHVVWVSETEEFLATEAVQHNFDPVIHRRLVVLIDRRYLLLLDRFENLSRESTIQLYWHFATDQVHWEEAQQSARAEVGGVQIWLRGPGKMKGELLEGKISERVDSAYPSKRLRLEDTPGRAAATYATLIIPFRSDETAPLLRAAHLQSSSVDCRLVMTEPRASRELIWRFGESLMTRVGMKITRSLAGALPLRRV